MTELSSHLHDPARLEALRAVALLDTPAEEAFDRLSRLAARLLDVPIALVSLVDADRQFFKSCIGLEAEPFRTDRETPLSHSFCQHNRVVGKPLVIKDVRTDPLFSANLAVRDLGVASYLGFPLTTADGYVLGSFCAIDTRPREWEASDIETIRDLAASVMVEINLRTEVATRHLVEGERDGLTELNDQLRAEIEAREIAEAQQKELQARLRQTQKVEATGQLAGGIAHDMNNLLSPILIYTSILMDDPELSARHHDIVDQMQSAGLRARDLIRQLMTFSRLQAMQLDVQDLNAIVTDIETLLRRTIPEDITFEIDLSREVGPILADVNQVEQIVMNLVVNAADAMPDGGSLSIRTGMAVLNETEVAENPDAQPGAFATLAVSDNGIGVHEDIRSRIFEPFFSTKESDGNGLGLATVLGIVLEHGGVVKMSSDMDRGATFCVYFPLTDQAPTAEPPQKTVPSSAKRSGTILIAEDDEQVRRVTEWSLTARGFTVISTRNGVDALGVLNSTEETVDLLLTDVVMPEMNGGVLYERVSEMHPDLPVLFMSGYSDEIISHRGVLDTGINFIAKPFTEAELVSQIDLLLHIKSQ